MKDLKVTQATNDVIWDWDIINPFYRSKAVASLEKMQPVNR
jgi:hypothetical protein